MNTEDLIELHIQSLDAYNKGRRAMSKEEMEEALFHFLRALDLFPEAMLVEPQLDRQTRLSMQQLKANILSHIELVKEDYPGLQSRPPAGFKGLMPGEVRMARAGAAEIGDRTPEPVVQEDEPELPELSLDDLVEPDPEVVEDSSHKLLDSLLDDEFPAAPPVEIPEQQSPYEEEVQEEILPEPELEIEPVVVQDEIDLSDLIDEPPGVPEMEEPLLVPEEPELLAEVPEPESLKELLDELGGHPADPPSVMEDDHLPEVELPDLELKSEHHEEETLMVIEESSGAPTQEVFLGHLLSDMEPPEAGSPAPLEQTVQEESQSFGQSEMPLPPTPEPVAAIKQKKGKRKKPKNPRLFQQLILLALVIVLGAVSWSNYANLTFNSGFKAYQEEQDLPKKVAMLKGLYAKASFMEKKNFVLKTVLPEKHKLSTRSVFVQLDGSALQVARDNPRYKSEFLELVDGRHWSLAEIEKYLQNQYEIATSGEAKLDPAYAQLGAKLANTHCSWTPELCKLVKPVFEPFGKVEHEKTEGHEEAHKAEHPPVEPQKHDEGIEPAKSENSHTEAPVKKEPVMHQKVEPEPKVNVEKSHTLKEQPSKISTIARGLEKLGIRSHTLSFSTQGETLFLSYKSRLADPDVIKATKEDNHKSLRNDEFMDVMNAVVNGLSEDDSYLVNHVEFRMLNPKNGRTYKAYRVKFQPYMRWVKTGKTGSLSGAIQAIP